MEQAETNLDAFNAFEAAGWEEKAAGYDTFLGAITSRVVEPLLDAADVGPGTRLLDVATGPGYAAGRAAERGASVVGVDGSRAMVELAMRLRPGLDIRRADANALPFEDGSFDAAVGNFVILHLGRPERAVSEFVRVLAPGGRLALTAWDLPDRVRFLGVFLEAIAEIGAAPSSDIPVGPDFFRFSIDEEFDRLLGGQGLTSTEVRTVAFEQLISSTDELWDGVLGGTVRTSALILRQSEQTQNRIREAFDRRLEPYRVADGFKLPVSVKLAVGRKAA